MERVGSNNRLAPATSPRREAVGGEDTFGAASQRVLSSGHTPKVCCFAARALPRRPVSRQCRPTPLRSGGRHPVTPWGKPTKGKKTRKNKATDKMSIRRRHATR